MTRLPTPPGAHGEVRADCGSATRARRKPPYSDEAVRYLRDHMCPYCKTSTLEGTGAGRGRKRCTECGASFGIPRRRASRVTPR
jgi:hypothetical protein